MNNTESNRGNNIENSSMNKNMNNTKSCTGNNTTELVFILDRSGSMGGMESDTIGGFNAMIEKQKAMDGKACVSTVLFSTDCEVLHDRVMLSEVKPMTREDYSVGGCTALIDAIGGAVHHIGNVHKYARPEDVPAHTVFVIMTDGLENASRRYSSREVKKMIRRQEERYGWEFLFLGANIDAVETAGSFGIREDHAADYRCDTEGNRVVYATVSEAVCTVRKGDKLSPRWSEKIKEDYEKRK